MTLTALYSYLQPTEEGVHTGYCFLFAVIGQQRAADYQSSGALFSECARLPLFVTHATAEILSSLLRARYNKDPLHPSTPGLCLPFSPSSVLRSTSLHWPPRHKARTCGLSAWSPESSYVCATTATWLARHGASPHFLMGWCSIVRNSTSPYSTLLVFSAIPCIAICKGAGPPGVISYQLVLVLPRLLLLPIVWMARLRDRNPGTGGLNGFPRRKIGLGGGNFTPRWGKFRLGLFRRLTMAGD